MSIVIYMVLHSNGGVFKWDWRESMMGKVKPRNLEAHKGAAPKYVNP
jgi:hypothetical protein